MELHVRDSNLGCISSGAVQLPPVCRGNESWQGRSPTAGSSEVGPTRDLEAAGRQQPQTNPPPHNLAFPSLFHLLRYWARRRQVWLRHLCNMVLTSLQHRYLTVLRFQEDFWAFSVSGEPPHPQLELGTDPLIARPWAAEPVSCRSYGVLTCQRCLSLTHHATGEVSADATAQRRSRLDWAKSGGSFRHSHETMVMLF